MNIRAEVIAHILELVHQDVSMPIEVTPSGRPGIVLDVEHTVILHPNGTWTLSILSEGVE